MARIRPFGALRPRSDLAGRICAPPYDVLSSDEAREMARNNPLSFLHVSKPEIDLAPSIDPHDVRVYEKGRENFQKLICEGALVQDKQPRFYLYRQSKSPHSQTGLVALASCEDYERQIIKKHELTRPDKEEDRIRHIEALNAQTGPAFLIYRSNTTINHLVASKILQTPDIDFIADDGVAHTAWTITDSDAITALEEAFHQIPNLYIADGHHRTAAAVRVWKKRNQGAMNRAPTPHDSLSSILHPPSSFFLSVLFPHDQVRILPYNRVVKDLHGLGLDGFVQRMRELGRFEIHAQSHPSRKPVRQAQDLSRAKPRGKHEICIFLDGAWHLFRWNPDLVALENSIGRLDAALLQKHVLAPLLGIDDPRTSKKIAFVGGLRGATELEKLVRSDEYAVAFSMFPTSVDDLLQIADQGGIMPPKSTWFEPKLRDAMFCHMLD